MTDMRKLKVDMDTLKFALESNFSELWHYLDLETGDVVMVTDDTRRQLHEIWEEHPDASPAIIEAAIQEEEDPDERQDLHIAFLVDMQFDERFIEVPTGDTREAYHDMQAFIATVEDGAFQEQLDQAIQGRGAFRRFKDALLDRPEERERWFSFQDARLERRARNWLEMHGVEAIDDNA